MPYVNIKLTGDSEAPTPEQKEQLIAGVTKLIADVLGKDTTHLVIVIDEVPMTNYGINGKTVKQLRSEKKTQHQKTRRAIRKDRPSGRISRVPVYRN